MSDDRSPVHAGPDDSGELDVQVVPRASRSRIVGLHDGRLKIQLAAPPVDGAANAALVELLADTLAVPRGDVAVVRGHTGKRKTLRIAGLAAAELRRRLGDLGLLGLVGLGGLGGRLGVTGLIAALGLAAASGGCQTSYGLPITVVLPLEQDDLEAADNVLLALDPQDLRVSYEVDGLDFSVQLELEPDDRTTTLALYLANGEELLAWGRSAPFVLSAPPDDLGVYVSPPGALSTFPGKIGKPDPALLASPAIGRGMLMLDSDGATALFNAFTLATEEGATLEALPLPAADDGVLVPDSRGGVWRVAWATKLQAHRYEPGSDAWTTATLEGDPGAPRPGAAHLLDASSERLLVLGGGEQRSILELDLLREDDTDPTHVVTTLEAELDAPRRGATAAYVVRSDGDAGEGVLVVGGDDPAVALAYFVPTTGAAGTAFGAPEAWTGLRCAALDADAGEADVLRVLCLGGLRGGAATADAIVLNFPPAAADQAPTLEVLPAFLPEPAGDPRLFEDSAAIYAQSGPTWLRIERAPGAPAIETLAAPSTRVRGGHSVLLATGATFLVGGWTVDDAPVDHWHVFAPSLASP
jgi:uncharacterized protein (TIGR00251 family)